MLTSVVMKSVTLGNLFLSTKGFDRLALPFSRGETCGLRTLSCLSCCLLTSDYVASSVGSENQ